MPELVKHRETSEGETKYSLDVFVSQQPAMNFSVARALPSCSRPHACGVLQRRDGCSVVTNTIQWIAFIAPNKQLPLPKGLYIIYSLKSTVKQKHINKNKKNTKLKKSHLSCRIHVPLHPKSFLPNHYKA